MIRKILGFITKKLHRHKWADKNYEVLVLSLRQKLYLGAPSNFFVSVKGRCSKCDLTLSNGAYFPERLACALNGMACRDVETGKTTRFDLNKWYCGELFE